MSLAARSDGPAAPVGLLAEGTYRGVNNTNIELQPSPPPRIAAANAVAGAVLLLSFYVNGASFLAYATIAEKRKMASDGRGQKSLFFTVGLAEATETILVFAAFCLFPAWFSVLAYLFAALTFYTAVSRIVLAWRTFG